MNLFYILFFIAALGLIWGISIYHDLIRSRALVDEAWSGISEQLKRRFGLIPKLIGVLKNYGKGDSEPLEKVNQLRNAAAYTSPFDIPAQAQASEALSQGLRTIFALAENDNDLKAITAFTEIQTALQKVEHDLQHNRRSYNAIVREYNIKCESFPSNVIAYLLQFSKKAFFESTNREEVQNVEISLTKI
ncbi:LemA family protein [Runella sp.]|uniref:LemA family protein n=1 Tax=Runella sp. TaxID=1960881 RepID=UPI003D103C2C